MKNDKWHDWHMSTVQFAYLGFYKVSALHPNILTHYQSSHCNLL